MPSPRLRLLTLVLSCTLAAAGLLVGAGTAQAGIGEVVMSQGKPIVASSQYSAAWRPAYANDGISATRWSSAWGNSPQWIRIDLGAVKDITHVRLNWEAAYATSYKIQISNNATTWATIYNTSSGNGGIDELYNLHGTARYVRMYATGKVTPWGYSLYEFRVYGPGNTPGSESSKYNSAVLADHPVAFWNLDSSNTDLTGRGHTLSRGNSPGLTTGPNGEPATVFNGLGQYLQTADANDLSVTNTGKLTVEAWMRPDVLNFPDTQSSGEPFVYWMGKGVSGQHEWTFRMYNKSSDRPNRISTYSYNLSGGLGAGSYFQDSITTGRWIHVVGVIDRSAGTVAIYKNGVLRDRDLLSGYNIHPGNGSAPMRIGTRDLMSYFKGGMAKVAVYNTALTSTRINAHYHAMVG